jgi:hypothetical protein
MQAVEAQWFAFDLSLLLELLSSLVYHIGQETLNWM